MNKDFFAQPEVKKLFDNYNSRERIRLVKVACWFAIIAMPSAVFLDVIDYPHYARYFFELRLACSLLSFIILGLVYTPWGERNHLYLTLMLATVSQGFIAWMIYASEGGVSPYYAILNLPLLIYCLLFPWTHLITYGLSLITIVLYLIACFAHGGVMSSHIFFSNLIFLIYTVTFAVMGSYFTNQLRIREFTTRYELDENRKQLAEFNQKLIELDRMKSQFFANISHELRTPLTLLIAPLEELLRSTFFDAGTRETFLLMQANAMRLLKLINDLLDLAKLESGRIEIRK
ncbi:MAG TPA: histidine kinase dimerization/phospho-acceptor domain-containing protein, partial [bacterium]|nr:histidine kinase dimerization/phospho-acceptor domain-containing protein [bacterium]